MFSNAGIMSRTCAFVLAGGGKRLDPLTRDKAKPLVHFGGTFRIIDFTLSNCLNSGLKNVYLLTQQRHEAFCQYIQHAGRSGLFGAGQGELVKCLCPKSGSNYRGSADAILHNMEILEGGRHEFVLILPADHIYKMDYTKLLRWHVESGASITVAGMQYPRARATRLGVLQVNSRHEVTAFEHKPDDPAPLPNDDRMALVSMGIYVFNTRTLLKTIIEDRFRTRSSHDIGRDVIPAAIGPHAVCAYNVSSFGAETARYWRDVGTIDAYYRSHMELLLADSPFDPYNDALWPTYAFGNNSHRPSYPRAFGRGAARDSVVSEPSAISGARVVQSVVAPTVRVEASADIQQSVLLPGVRVGRGARVRRAIVDENAGIPDGLEIGYDREMDRRHFLVTPGGVVVVTRDALMRHPDWSRAEAPRDIRQTSLIPMG